jgi:hypothetical protein
MGRRLTRWLRNKVDKEKVGRAGIKVSAFFLQFFVVFRACCVLRGKKRLRHQDLKATKNHKEIFRTNRRSPAPSAEMPFTLGKTSGSCCVKYGAAFWWLFL